MRDWRKVVVGPEATLEETMRVIDRGAERIALVADAQDRLLGVVTDGDMRRALLRHLPLETPVTEVMNREPVTADINDDREERRRLMDARRLYQLPIVTRDGRLVGMDTLRDLMERPVHDNLVVLMAGGLGTRLGPLTKRAPKPLLKVGPRPILETILTSIAGCGFRRFRISVNYRAEMIERHFGDGSRFGVEIAYLREDRRLGTAGPLSLIDEPLDRPVLVMNGDILTRVNFEALLAFHEERGGRATMCVREYGYQVPFGTVSVEGDRALEIAEKPVQQFFINAGIYVLEPEVVARVPKNRYYDMPDLLQSLIEEGEKLAVFPIHEYWHDIGRPEDFDRAQIDFERTFVAS